MANKFQQPIDQANKGIQSIIKNLEDLDAQILRTSGKLSNSFNIKSNSSINQQLEDQKKLIDSLNLSIQKQREELEKLKRVKTNVAKKTQEQKVAEQALNKEQKLQAQSTSKLVGAYGRLLAQQRKLRTAYRNSIVETGRFSKQTLRLKAAFEKVNRSVAKTNKATRMFSGGGLKNLIGGFSKLLGAFGIIGGSQLLAKFGLEAFNLAKKLDSLNFTMQRTITNNRELAESNDFLQQITSDYGVELISTTERYIKFDAAARQSNVSMEDTQKIFGTTTKAAGVLGLKTDELTGVYLALEQMLSKGKVTTEELRRQLGERLPGAFGIMADAIGVSTSQLDKMLKAGEILSSEALPKFAEQLEIAYGLESVTKIDTLVAAQNRITNAWTNFVASITGEGSILKSIFSGILDFTSAILENIQGISDTVKEAFESDAIRIAEENLSKIQKKTREQIDALNTYRKEEERLAEAIRIRFALEEGLLKIAKETNTTRSKSDLKSEIRTLGELAVKYQDFNKFLEEANTLSETSLLWSKSNLAVFFAKVRATEQVIESTSKLIDVNSEEISGRRELQDVINDLKEANDELQGSTKEEAKSILKKITLLEAEKKAWERLKKAKEDNAKAIELIGEYGSRDFIKAQIQGLNEQINKTSKLSSEYKGLTEQLSMMEDWYERLYGDSQAEKEENAVKRISELAGFYREFSDDLANSAGFDKLNQWFIQLDENDQTMFERLTDEAGEDEWKVYFNAITEIGQEAFALLSSFSGEYFQNQLERLEMEKETALMFAGESAVARENIERQYEERRAAIQRRQAEAEKEQALFNIAINTAQAIVATLGKEGFAGIPLSVIVGAIGAAQLAVVASTKVPEFFRGTMNAPEGWAMVDEKVPEVHTDKYGNIKSLGEDGANMRYLNQGDKIYKSHEYFFNKELGNTLAGNGILPYSDMIGFSSSAPLINIEKQRNDDVIMELKSLKNIISSKSGLTVNIDKNGVQTRMSKGLQNVNLKNNIIKLKGIEV